MTNLVSWWTRLRDALPQGARQMRHLADRELVCELARELAGDPELRPLFSECRQLATTHRKEKDERSSRRNRPVVWGVSLIATAAAATGIAILILGPPGETHYVTKVGEQRTIIAEDDSVITLNTDTELRVSMGGATRRIRLERGQAFFSVTPDKTRPFEVVARGGIVRAVGTSFDVAMTDEPGKVRVTVLEGSVEILPRAADAQDVKSGVSPKLLHGEAATYGDGGAIGQIIPTDGGSVRAWREGKMDFDNQRLIEALAEHNRYTNKKIVLGDEHLKDLRISGTLRIGDTEGFLFLLKESLGLTVVEKEDTFVLLSASGLLKVDSEHVRPGAA